MQMKISVCIPTYNQAEYLSEAIISAFNQTIPPCEIIVSNDCSTDNTVEVLQKLISEISLLKVINQTKNLGISQNTDACLRAASGEFIVRLDSDDMLSPGYIEQLGALLLSNPNAAYAHAAVQEIDNNGKFLQQRLLARKPGFQSSNEALLAAKKGFRVAANIIMFRKNALEKVDFSTKRPSYVEDFHLSAALAAAGFGNVYHNGILSFYRVWVDDNKVRQRRKLLEIVGVYRVFEEVLEPAYKARGWDLVQLYKQRAAFAKELADCLGWSVYTIDEKKEIVRELSKLSSSKKSKLIAYFYLKGFGSLMNICFGIPKVGKSIFKKIYNIPVIYNIINHRKPQAV
ncbi:glycosyltransferase family 2 protein [Hymenobacter sp. RP-2-7]|uniref:Glycosyltransferase family 2 protein n=1 Tax=Hymenobacter polaris TaxID=2682546 RepID=A0A7Y0FLC3_9BACT|nr:glycosyltransferase family 2 protein [Hymenobacter polaris]NML64663.1 glycosyltransferase family 2 protein [Hymenobacter polaris]